MEVSTQLARIDSRLREYFFSLTGEPDSAQPQLDFEDLSHELFSVQFQLNAPYRSLCEARGVTPHTLQSWKEIPGVPTSAFKELEFSCLTGSQRTTVFHSSGTTMRKPSRHYHNERSLTLYEASLLSWFRVNCTASEGRRDAVQRAPKYIWLTPPRSAVPRSSLVYMFDTLSRTLSAGSAMFLGQPGESGLWTVDFEKTRQALENACAQGQAVFLGGTAFSFVHLLDELAERGISFSLPKGSVVLETGGYKGQSRAVPREELHALIARYLCVSPQQIICEYGMCELSSQAYATPPPTMNSQHSRVFHLPPWARALVVSPESGLEVVEGEIGIVRVIDLANAYSVLAVQTEDLGIRQGAGFELIGRAAAAEPRGCSLVAAGA